MYDNHIHIHTPYFLLVILRDNLIEVLKLLLVYNVKPSIISLISCHGVINVFYAFNGIQLCDIGPRSISRHIFAPAYESHPSLAAYFELVCLLLFPIECYTCMCSEKRVYA